MTDIPDRERGYSIEADTAVVHERYQDHAPRAMRTSALGVTNVLDGREAVLCPVCFPAPKAKRGKAADGGEVTPRSISREEFGLSPREPANPDAEPA